MIDTRTSEQLTLNRRRELKLALQIDVIHTTGIAITLNTLFHLPGGNLRSALTAHRVEPLSKTDSIETR